VRQPCAPVVSWAEQHFEEITQVRFHPRSPGRLISASVDGLLCQSQFNAILAPEEALQSVIQTAASIDAFAFTPTLQAPEAVAIWSPMQTALFADLDSGELLGNLGDLRRVPGAEATQIIAFDSNPETDCPIYFAALPDGRVQVFLIRSWAGVEGIAELSRGHCEAVRSVLYLPEHGVLFTGGEDAKLIGWNIN
jgi:WD40 repeat protein